MDRGRNLTKTKEENMKMVKGQYQALGNERTALMHACIID